MDGMTGASFGGVAQSAFGVLALVALAWMIGRAPKGVPWRAVGIGIVIQVVIALILLKLPPVQAVFVWINQAVSALVAATKAGTSVVFGYLGGGAAPFEATNPANSFVLAFQGLPLILVVGAIAGLLYHWGVIPFFVRAFSSRARARAARPEAASSLRASLAFAAAHRTSEPLRALPTLNAGSTLTRNACPKISGGTSPSATSMRTHPAGSTGAPSGARSGTTRGGSSSGS